MKLVLKGRFGWVTTLEYERGFITVNQNNDDKELENFTLTKRYVAFDVKEANRLSKFFLKIKEKGSK